MSDMPEGFDGGERARLFPVLAETSKEGRTTSVFLACLSSVHEYGAILLSSLGQRVGARARIDCYTEIGFPTRKGESKPRPDGLIVLRVGPREWKAIVETKVGSSDLTTDQVEKYATLAAAHGCDAVVTISNAFTPTPAQHPLNANGKVRIRGGVELFHWSWMSVLTEADLLLSNDDVIDADQRYLLSELVRFLTHPSAGVKGFDAMPKAWGELAQKVRAGGAVSQRDPDAREVVGAWHQEVRDLSLKLSQRVGVPVRARISRAQAKDPVARMKADLALLSERKCVAATFDVPGAVAPVEVCCDLGHRSILLSVRMKAPQDRQSTKARLNWLLKQLSKADPTDLHIRLFWPGRGAHTQHTLAELREDPSLPDREKSGSTVTSFEICMLRDLGGRFVQSRNFIADLEKAVPAFYDAVVQDLKAWQAPAPRLRQDRAEPTPAELDAVAEELREGASTYDA